MFDPSPTLLNELFQFGNFISFPLKDIPQYAPTTLPSFSGVSLLYSHYCLQNNPTYTFSQFISRFHNYLHLQTHLDITNLFSGFVLLDSDNDLGDFRLSIVRGCLIRNLRLSSTAFSGFFDNEIFRYNSRSPADFTLHQNDGFDNLLLLPLFSELIQTGICLCRFMPKYFGRWNTEPSLADKIGLTAFGLYLPNHFRVNPVSRQIHFLLYSPESSIFPTFTPLFTVQRKQKPTIHFFQNCFVRLHFDTFLHNARFNGRRIFTRGDCVRNLTRLRFLRPTRSLVFDYFPDFSRISVLHHCSKIFTCSSAGRFHTAIKQSREFQAFYIPKLAHFYHSCSSERRQHHLSTMFTVVESRVLPSGRVALCASVKPMLMIQRVRSRNSQWTHFCSAKTFVGTESSFEIFCTHSDCHSCLKVHGNSIILIYLCNHLENHSDGKPVNAQFTPPTRFYTPELLPLRDSIDLLFRHLQITTPFQSTSINRISPRSTFSADILNTFDDLGSFHFQILEFTSTQGLSAALLYARIEELIDSIDMNEIPHAVFILPRQFDKYDELDWFLHSRSADDIAALRLDLDTPSNTVLPSPGIFFTDHVGYFWILSRFFPTAPEGVTVFQNWHHYSLSDIIGKVPFPDSYERFLSPVFFDLVTRHPGFNRISSFLFKFGFDIFQIRLFVLAACFRCCITRYNFGFKSNGLIFSDIPSAYRLLEKLSLK